MRWPALAKTAATDLAECFSHAEEIGRHFLPRRPTWRSPGDGRRQIDGARRVHGNVIDLDGAEG
jgi:hypothetical protein